jgi:hypothetical protein
MGVEDAGTIALLMQYMCIDNDGNSDLTNFGEATRIYERLRIPRTSTVLDCSKQLGGMEKDRSKNGKNVLSELLIQGEVMMNKTLPVMFTGATYNYSQEVTNALLVEEEKEEIGDPGDFSRLMLERELLMQEALLSIYGGVPRG